MPALIAAMAAGTGLQFAGGMMQANAGVSRRTQRRRGKHALDQARAQDQLFGSLEEAQLKTAHGKERAGFAGARKALDLGATAARQNVAGRGKIAQGELEQSIVGRGLLGTTSGIGKMAQLQDRTTAQLSAIDMQLAQSLADLGLDESELLGQQGRELTGMAAKRRAMEKEFGEANFGLLTLG